MERSDEELVADYVAGDEAAFSILIGRHMKPVYSFVAHFIGDREEAEDIVQETFLKAWKSARNYRAESSKFRTWILRIARNSAIDYLRKRKHVSFSEFDTAEGQNVLAETVPDPAELPDEIAAKAQDREILERAVATLSPEAREILTLHYTNGLTFLEIGEFLSEPQNTVKSRHHRAIQALKKRLDSLTDQGHQSYQ